MNTQKNFNFFQKPLCPSFIQPLIKFSQMNFLRVLCLKVMTEFIISVQCKRFLRHFSKILGTQSTHKCQQFSPETTSVREKF